MHAKIRCIKVCLTLCACLFTVLAVGAQTVMEPAVILREGTWDGGVGTFQIPEAFGKIKPDVWPVDGWYRLIIRPDGIESVAEAKARARQVNITTRSVPRPRKGRSNTPFRVHAKAAHRDDRWRPAGH